MIYDYLTSEIDDPWTSEDLINYDMHGDQMTNIIYNSFHNAKIRLLEKNLYHCSFKNKNGLYKNIYVVPITSSKFVFYSYFPQLRIILEYKKTNQDNTFIEKCPILNSITNELLKNGQCKICEDIIIKGETVFTIVNGPVRQFLFPANRRIENEDILKKLLLTNNLYSRISKEYDALCSAIIKYIDGIKYKEEKAKILLAKQIIKASIKIGLYASGIGTGAAILMDINEISNVNDSISAISDFSELYDLETLSSLDELSDISDYGDELTGYEYMTSFPDNEDLSITPESLDSESVNNNPSFEGKASDEESYKWYKEKEKHALNEQNSHYEKAKKALERGDQHAYTDHIRRAKSWQTQIDDWGNRAKQIKR